jgi:hypothetical protein
MWNVKSETVYSSWTPGIEQAVSTCDVYVGGKLY